VINFGAIEVQTYEWIRHLSKDGSHLKAAIKKSFDSRTKCVGELLEEASLADSFRLDCGNAWDEAKDLAMFRNQIAHSPIVFVWKNREAVGNPDAIGVLDYRKGSGEIHTTMNYIGEQSLSDNIDEAVRIATRLQGLLDRILSMNAS